MYISKKLMIIVFLTIMEVSITIWAAFQISSGAHFHQLNYLHLKHNSEFSNLIRNIEDGSNIDIAKLKSTILDIKQQPIDCLAEVNFIDKFIMEKIGTFSAVNLCKKDIKDADSALDSLNQYQAEILSRNELIKKLYNAEEAFKANSNNFEKPVTDTVAFIIKTMIPMIVIISLFNIIFISYLSSTISKSIKKLIQLLSKPASYKNNILMENHLSGELKELMAVAKERIQKDLMNVETNEELEKIVNAKTSSLKKANEELAEFAYRASHDLKSPLSTSKSLAHFIITDIKSGNIEEASKNAKVIHQQLDKLEVLVADILSLTRADLAEEGKDIIDFKKLIATIEDRSRSIIDKNQCHFTSEINISEPVYSESARFSQILENIISNSIKYADRHKKESFVNVKIFDDEKNLHIETQDNGVGIPKANQNELFTMFKRFHPHLSDGSGLGMSIVKKHIEHLHGMINFTSSDKGTHFTIKFSKENLQNV